MINMYSLENKVSLMLIGVVFNRDLEKIFNEDGGLKWNKELDYEYQVKAIALAMQWVIQDKLRPDLTLLRLTLNIHSLLRINSRASDIYVEIKEILECLDKDPYNIESYFNLAVCYLNLCEYHNPLEINEKIIRYFIIKSFKSSKFEKDYLFTVAVAKLTIALKHKVSLTVFNLDMFQYLNTLIHSYVVENGAVDVKDIKSIDLSVPIVEIVPEKLRSRENLLRPKYQSVEVF